MVALNMRRLTDIITATDPALRDQSLDVACAGLSLDELLAECAALDAFRRGSENLYDRVRALFFVYAIHRFHLPLRLASGAALTQRGSGLIPLQGFDKLLHLRFDAAIYAFLSVQ